MIRVPEPLRPHINVSYPPNNNLIFEEWVYENFTEDVSDREYLPIFWTSYYVNNDYGNNKEAMNDLSVYLNDLPRDKKYFTICQYDDGIMNNIDGLDILQFSMSKKIGYELPLLCQTQPFQFNSSRLWLANFIGSRTHPIREYAEGMKKHGRHYISFNPHPIESYCQIISQSVFTLCFRGYGANSFRIQEAIQYGSIPVYISDEFIIPHKLDFNEYGVLIDAKDASRIDEILIGISHEETVKKQDRLKQVFEDYYTYEGNLLQIIKHLAAEHH